MRILIILLAMAAATVHAADGFTFSNSPGPHAVGVKFVQQYDQSRLYKSEVDLSTGEAVQGERSRPIQVVLWYPAARGGTPVSYRDYLETTQTEDDFTRTPAEVQRMTDDLINGNAGIRKDALQLDVVRPMQAVRNARTESGKFAVVVYAPSYSATAVENADLCEYLASHGYIVLSSASLGSHTRAMTTDVDGAEAQAADISYLIAYAASLPQADSNQVGVVGFSWGGLANVYAAARDKRIKALVSLDGSVRYYPQLVDGGKEAAPYVKAKQVAVPMLYLGAKPKTIEKLNSEETSVAFSFMNAMKYSDVYVMTMLPMAHADFSSYSIRMRQDNEFGDYSRAEISVAHSWAMRYTRHFLDAYLKGDAAGLAFLNNTPATNKVPPHTVLTDVRRKQDIVPATLENYVRRLASVGFDQAVPVYQQFIAQDAGFKLDPNQLYGWGLQLYRLNRLAQAREIFHLGVHLYPELSFMMDGLAEMQAKTGQEQEARKSYRRVLELDPKNVDAAKYLKEHGT